MSKEDLEQIYRSRSVVIKRPLLAAPSPPAPKKKRTRNGMLTDGRKFDLDLAKGQIGEARLAELLSAGTVEVKTEIGIWRSTRNICIEYEFNGQDSGIASTTADFWCHILNDKDGSPVAFLFFPIKALKEITRYYFSRGCTKSLGDKLASKAVLVPLDGLMTPLLDEWGLL